MLAERTIGSSTLGNTIRTSLAITLHAHRYFSEAGDATANDPRLPSPVRALQMQGGYLTREPRAQQLGTIIVKGGASGVIVYLVW